MEEKLRRLFQSDDSQLVEPVRWFLNSFRTFLEEAADRNPDDSGAEKCREISAELKNLLREDAQASPTADDETTQTAEENSAETAESGDALKAAENQAQSRQGAMTADSGDLTAFDSEAPKTIAAGVEQSPQFQSFREMLVNDAAAKIFLGNISFVGKDNNELWHELNLSLLRLPAQAEQKWRDDFKALAVEKIGARLTEGRNRLVSFYREKELIPALKGEHFDIEGVLLSPGGNQNDELRSYITAAETNSETQLLEKLASVVSLVCYLADADRHIQLRLNEMGRFPKNREIDRKTYIDTLKRRFFNFAQVLNKLDGSPTSIKTAADSCLEVVETISSLVYLPPVAASSWLEMEINRPIAQLLNLFKKMVNTSEEIVIFQTLRDVEYKSIKHKTNVDENTGVSYDFLEKGKVIVCLRPYAKIYDKTIKGRVIYVED